MTITFIQKLLLSTRPFNPFTLVLAGGYELPMVVDPKHLRTIEGLAFILDDTTGVAFLFEPKNILYVRIHEVKGTPSMTQPAPLSDEQMKEVIRRFGQETT